MAQPVGLYMGSLPIKGGWTRLEVFSNNLGLGNTDIEGMSFVLDGGRATWDVSGLTTTAYVPPPNTDPFELVDPNYFVQSAWIRGALPPGAITGHTDDQWSWIPCAIAPGCHQSVSGRGFRRHFFTGAAPQPVKTGDQWFTYVFLDPNQMPDQLFLEWHDGTNWASGLLGTNHIVVIPDTTGTENWRYMGGLPPAGKWVKLEVPASYVGLEGKFVSGAGFGFYSESRNAQILWGQSGRSPIPGPVPLTLSTLTGVYQFKHQDFGYYYSTKDVPLHSTQDRQDGRKFFVHPNQAAGTVPFFRFVNSNLSKREFFYSTCANCANPNDWVPNGIAFYVYPTNTSTPGTVPLYLHRDSAQHYFLSLNQTEAGMTLQGLSAYVNLENPLVPARPTSLSWIITSCRLNWVDNASTETGYRIDKRTGNAWAWTEVISLPANTTTFTDCNLLPPTLFQVSDRDGDQAKPSRDSIRPNRRFTSSDLRVVAVNSVGDSVPGDNWVTAEFIEVFAQADPTIRIVSPLNGAIVGKDLSIVAESFNEGGNASLAKVEFFDNGAKLGELTGPPPHNFIWQTAASGPHTLTAKGTDGIGRTVTSFPVQVTVTALPTVAITNPSDGSVITAPTNIPLQANASDTDGSISKVEFFQGNVKIGEDATPPYSVSWNSVQSGTYQVTARATDNVGMTVDSLPITVIANNPPSVSASVYTDTVTVQPGSEVLLTAEASDSDGTVSKVEFYRGGTTLIGTVTTFPFIYRWANVPSGIHSITAKATDNRGATTASGPVTLSVNAAPGVTITSPLNKAMLPPASDITISASATDDGTVTKVDFYQGSTLIGTNTSAPFSITWPNVAPGSYVLSAVATDNMGLSTTSPVVAITTPVFFDDFNDNSLDTAKWSVTTPGSTAVVSEQGQQLRIAVPANTATYNSIVSNATFDIRGGIVQVEQVQAVNQGGWAEDHLVIEKDANNYFMLHTGAGAVVLRSMVNGVNDQLVLLYDPVAYRYWRLRHDQPSNLAHFETSADAITWTTRKSVTPGFALTAVKFYLVAGAYGTGNSTPGAAIYDNFQAFAIPTTSSLLADDFNDNSLDSVKWIKDQLITGGSDPSVPVNEVNQRIQVGPLFQNTSGFHFNGIVSQNSYDFSDAYNYIQVISPPSSGTTGELRMSVAGANSPAGNLYRFIVIGPTLKIQRVIGGTAINLVSPFGYDLTSMRFLRIRHESATANVVFETAPQKAGDPNVPGAWTLRYQEPWANWNGTSGVQLTNVRFEVRAGTSISETNVPGTVAFDNFRVAKNNPSSASPPVVSITGPANNSAFIAPVSIPISADASDADGSITKVEFYVGTTLIGTDTIAPYAVSWTSVQGTHSLSAKATDNSGTITTSAPVSITVNAANSLPTVSITSPANNTTLTAPASFQFNANASDSDGSITKVEFYQNNTLVLTDTSAPYGLSMALSAGTYSLTAKAIDNLGAVTTSAPVMLISNALPTVSITSPVNRSMLAAGSNIVINANASDDGGVSKVEFYQGTTLIGTDTSAPFSVTWPSGASGFYNLTAKATDNVGATATSAIVVISTPTFFDDFNDNSLDASKWSLYVPSSPAVVSEQGQQLRITIPASTATYNGVVSNASYDIRGGSAQVELVQAVSQAGWVDNSMLVQRDDQNFYQIGAGAGSIVFRSRISGVESQTVITFDPVAHRFWRISHNQVSDLVNLETSGDGLTWTTRKTVTGGFSLVGVKFVLNAGAWGANNAAPGAAIYNDFQAIAATALPTSAPAIFSDDFNDNSLNTAKWNPDNLFSGFTSFSVPIAETAQRLEIGPLLQTVDGSSYRGVRSVNTYNLTGAYAYVELVQPPAAASGADAMFTIGVDVDNYYRIAVTAGNLWGQRKVGGTKVSLFSIPYDPVNHRYLRIRHEAGSVKLETAPGSGATPGTWTQRYSEIWSSAISPAALILELKGGTSKIEQSPPGKVIFDNFRVALNGS